MTYLGLAIFLILLIGSVWLLSGAMDNRIPRLRGSQNFLQNNLGGKNEVFMPSWLSSTGFMFMPFLLIAAGITWVTIIAIEKSSALAYFFGAYAALMAVLVWLMWRQLWGSAPLLQFGPNGVSARVLKGQTIAWKDITKISLHTVQRFGISRLTLHLAPQPGQQKKRFFSMDNSEQRFIPLGALRATDCARVLGAAQAAHDRYANTDFTTQPNLSFERDRPKAACPSI